jgi:hypothetical protein
MLQSITPIARPLPLRVISVGSNQAAASSDVRFAPKADKQADVSLSPLCAKTGPEQMQQHTVRGR